jgi:hypothetical protein
VVPVLSVALPDYTVDSEPDHRRLGKRVDDVLRRHCTGETVLVRGLSSAAHPQLSLDSLIEVIKLCGTDRYDTTRVGEGYDNIHGRHIDLFAYRRKIGPRTRVFEHLCWGFYHSAIAIHGNPVRLDLLTVYDASQFSIVPHRYEGRADTKRDGFAFKYPDAKPAALKAIIRLTF